MKVIEITNKNIAELLFKEKERLPRFGFYLTKTDSGDFEGGCEVGVIKFVDSYLVIGNYAGGGCPFCCDITSDTDSSGLEECMKYWLQEMDCDYDDAGYILHVDSAGSGGTLLPEVTIVIKDGGLTDVYSNLEALGVELIDLDVTEPEAVEDAEKALDEVKRDWKAGRLYSHW